MDKYDQLDEEFRCDLSTIKIFVGNLNSVDAKLCRSWLNKLFSSVHEKLLRNSLLKELIENVKRGSLQQPFNKPPNDYPLSYIKAGGEGEHIEQWKSDSSCTIFSPSENFTERNAGLEGYQTTDESEAVFPQNIWSKRSEPLKLTCWKETEEDVNVENEEIVKEESERKAHTLLSTIASLKAQNEALTHEVSLYQSTTETTRKELYNLNQEVITLRAKLSELQWLNTNIERKHIAAITEHKQVLTDSLLQVSERLKSVYEQNDELLNNVASLEFKLNHLNHQNEDSERKLKSEISQLKYQLAKEKEIHQAEIISFQNLLRQKNGQLKKVDCHVKMQCSRMQEEVTNIKYEMDQVANESNSQLKAKILLLKKDISKLERANKKLIAEYESRLKSCQQKYQLQVTKYSLQQPKKCENSTELEKAVIDLEKKYKKLLSDQDKNNALQRKHDFQKIQKLEQELLKYKKK